jgi:hypothetical protein
MHFSIIGENLFARLEDAKHNPQITSLYNLGEPHEFLPYSRSKNGKRPATPRSL